MACYKNKFRFCNPKNIRRTKVGKYKTQRRKFMKKLFTAIIFCVSLCLSVSAQTNQKPCSQPEAGQFDFWLGAWNLEWKTAKGEVQNGTNTITKIMGDCVIQENFDGGEQMKFKGMSNSVFDARAGMWKQTWVDDAGGYLDFTGEFKDGKMILRREFMTKDNKKTMQKMVFYNISKDALDWNWENSTDDGKTWNLVWKIHYKRKG